MKVLIIKMSSMGDVLHTLPALTDAGEAIKDISFDWVVEENFQEIPHWHPLVDKVIPIALRRWRKNMFAKQTREEWKAFKKNLQEREYDLIIDAQGLLKSAFVASFAKGKKVGLNYQSAREPFASWFYKEKFAVAKKQHAVTRVRMLFSQALKYPLEKQMPDYAVDRKRLAPFAHQKPYIVFLHATTWPTKHWPETYWIELAKLVAAKGFDIKLPWGNPAEKERAERIAATCSAAEVLPKLSLQAVASVLVSASGVVAVDTGLCHLAAALNVPTVSLYGPTNPELTGALGQSQKHLRVNFPCAPCFGRDCTYQQKNQPPLYPSPLNPPCFTTLPPDLVLGELAKLLSLSHESLLRSDSSGL